MLRAISLGMLEKLSAAAVTRKAEFRKPGRYADGGGLYLQVTGKTDGGVTRAWLFQYSWKGKVRQMGLGSLDAVTLAQARRLAKAAREKVAAGIDPIAEKQAGRRAAVVEAVLPQTFEAFATEYIATHSPSWRNEVHRKQWTSTLKTYAYPIIGRLNVADIETSDVIRVLKPIWSKKLETADRVRGRIEKVLHAAKAAKLRVGDNPAIWKNHLDHLLPSKKKNERHHPAMPYADLPDFMRDLVKRNGIAPRALEVLILTVARTTSLIGMQDGELDLRNAHTWTIPGSRMKGGKEHTVPLPERAREIIASIPREKGNPHLFMGQKPGTHLSNMSMLELMRKIAPEYVPHGFRSSFDDWASEETDAKHIVVEKCMAHAIKDKTERAYRRGELLELRRTLMDQWARYLYGA
jgi:integrase